MYTLTSSVNLANLLYKKCRLTITLRIVNIIDTFDHKFTYFCLQYTSLNDDDVISFLFKSVTT